MWFAIVGKRTDQGTTAFTRSPTAKPVPSKTSTWSSPTRIASTELCPGARLFVLEPAGVADLASARRIERGPFELRFEAAVAEVVESDDRRQNLGLVVPDEFGRRPGKCCDDPAAAGARDLAVLGHALLEVVLVHGNSALERELAGQLERKAVGRGQIEGFLAGNGTARGDLLEELHPARQRLGEALFLGAQHLTDPLAILRELRKPVAHLLDHGVADAPEVVEPDRARLVDGPADDPAQDVATPLVRRRDAVGDEEGHPAAVVGEDPVRLRGRLGVAERHTALLRDPAHDRLVAVGLVDGADVLHHRREPLEAQAGVDVLLRERCQRPVRVLLELHEDEIPELEEAIAAWARGRARRVAAAVLRSPVPVDLGVGAARPGPPTDQKFSALGSATMRSGGIPIASHSLIATSSGPSLKTGSPAWTVTQMRSQSSCSRSWMNSVASSIAPFLKYWPNEKLPSISKNVRWCPSRPTSSMSCVRKHFCEVS